MRSRPEELRLYLSRIAMLVVGIAILLSRSHWEETDEAVAFTLSFFGMIMIGIASLGRMWCSLYIAGCKDKKLITQGPYSLCRNPLYLFSLIGVIGVGLTTETFTFPVLLAALFGLYYPFVIRGEERRLRDLFGGDYESYVKNVPRLFPTLRYFSEPQAYSVAPKTYRRHMFSALWFIWAVGIIEVFEGLGEMGIVPTLWAFY